MTDVEELGATLAALREAFEALGVAWAVGGSLASAAYGEPRATNDVNVVAALDRDAALALPRLLPDFYRAAEAAMVRPRGALVGPAVAGRRRGAPRR